MWEGIGWFTMDAPALDGSASNRLKSLRLSVSRRKRAVSCGILFWRSGPNRDIWSTAICFVWEHSPKEKDS